MGLATVRTGISGLDELLGGGIPKGSTLLISGPPGAGKTTMALQYTFSQARKGERVLFVSTCELLYSINKFASSLSFFDLGLIRTGVNLDFYGPREEGGFVEFWDYSLGPILAEQSAGDIFDVIQEKVNSHRIDHLVIDSVTSIHLFLGDETERRKKLLLFMGWASRSGCNTIFTADSCGTEGVERLLADGIVDLKRQEMPTRDGPGVSVRTVEVVKIRGMGHRAGRYIYHISADGVSVIVPGSGEPPAAGSAKTGVAGLDDVLAGMAYGSAWHYRVGDASFLAPLTDAMAVEALGSGDNLVYVAPSGFRMSVESFRRHFGPEDELAGRMSVLDFYGLQAPDSLKGLVVPCDPGKTGSIARSLASCGKGQRCRILLDAGGMETIQAAGVARNVYAGLLGFVRENGSLLVTITGPAAGGALLGDIVSSSDGIVDIWDYGGYALLQVKKAPYAKSFEPFSIRLKDGRISLTPL